MEGGSETDLAFLSVGYKLDWEAAVWIIATGICEYRPSDFFISKITRQKQTVFQATARWAGLAFVVVVHLLELLTQGLMFLPILALTRLIAVPNASTLGAQTEGVLRSTKAM